MSDRETVKVTFEMTPEEVEDLKRLAEERRLTMTDTLRQAAKNERFFRDSVKEGKLILLQKPDRTYERVILP